MWWYTRDKASRLSARWKLLSIDGCEQWLATPFATDVSFPTHVSQGRPSKSPGEKVKSAKNESKVRVKGTFWRRKTSSLHVGPSWVAIRCDTHQYMANDSNGPFQLKGRPAIDPFVETTPCLCKTLLDVVRNWQRLDLLLRTPVMLHNTRPVFRRQGYLFLLVPR